MLSLQDVPLENGVALFEAAVEPKCMEVIPKANHLLTSTSHYKKAAKAVCVAIEKAAR